MKCLEKDEKVVKVKDSKVEELLQDGWKLCPKWKWKDQEGVEYRGERL